MNGQALPSTVLGLPDVAADKLYQVTIDISDLKVSDDPNAVLITYALGSCIAVIVYDAVKHVGGMIHYMLPLSNTAPDKAQTKPAMFADTGVPLLFLKLYEYGCRKQDLVVKIAGGGKLYEDHGVFDIGKRNYTVLRKIFWKNDIIIAAEDVGGAKSRTAKLYVGNGLVTIRAQGQETPL
ncbi:MAG: chemotaxis protein CheD [Myxococcales bacterium]|nr:MAG: chemotaxis protein CheD [Myxococcales bacterium]